MAKKCAAGFSWVIQRAMDREDIAARGNTAHLGDRRLSRRADADGPSDRRRRGRFLSALWLPYRSGWKRHDVSADRNDCGGTVTAAVPRSSAMFAGLIVLQSARKASATRSSVKQNGLPPKGSLRCSQGRSAIQYELYN